MNRLFLLLFGAVSLVAHAQVPDYVPTEGLVAWYPFNGNANDESGNGYHGVVNGPALGVDRFEQEAACFDFNSSEFNYISTEVNAISEDDNRSFSFWIRVDEGREGNYVLSYGPAGLGGSCNAGFHIEVGLNDCSFVGLGVGANCYQRREPFDLLHNNSWHHCAITYGGAGLDASDFWIDGILQMQTGCLDGNFPSALNTSTLLGMSIGKRNDDNPNSYFDGIIDDIGIWNRALTEEEILALYNAEPPVTGCTDSTACNFDAEATSDDGSCIPSGCMDSEACNYNAFAECEGEACEYSCCPGPGCCAAGTSWDYSLEQCVPIESACSDDLDGDGVIGVNDLMQLLSSFGTDCAPTEEPETAEWTCGDPVSYHGYDYATVQIGEQCWFAENLRTELYQNGDSIPGNLTSSQWTSTNEGAQAVYANDEGNLELYGRLYNGYAMNDTRALCPLNWHIPSDEDWGELELELGLDDGELLLIGERGDDQGAQLKASPSDSPSWDGSNTVGFHAVANGYRHNHGYYQHLNFNSHYWSKTASEEGIFYIRTLQSAVEGVIRLTRVANSGYSIRCLKD